MPSLNISTGILFRMPLLSRRLLTRSLTLVFAIGVAAISAGQTLRIATWNITNYGGGRTADLQNALFGSFEGRSLSPDVVVAQEFLSQAAADSFLTMLNTVPGGTGDWAAATFVNGPDTDNAFFYRTTKANLLGQAVISLGGNDPLPPRNTLRYDLQLGTGGAKLSIYSSHMKSGTASSDEARRLAEARAIRNDAESLAPDVDFVLGGDLNVQRATDDAYAELIGSQSNNEGRFFDPVASPGVWNDSNTLRFLHTQDPTGTGGMDDRFDFLLGGAGLFDGAGLDYVGNSGLAFSTTTWNDPNHSYRTWGNDGTSLNGPLTITGNTMVGSSIAQSLANVATTNGGHLPVFMDLNAVPEPASIAALAVGGLALLRRRRQGA